MKLINPNVWTPPPPPTPEELRMQDMVAIQEWKNCVHVMERIFDATIKRMHAAADRDDILGALEIAETLELEEEARIYRVMLALKHHP